MKLQQGQSNGYKLASINERAAGAGYEAMAQGMGVLGQSLGRLGQVADERAQKLQKQDDYFHDDAMFGDHRRNLSADLNKVSATADAGGNWQKLLGEIKAKHSKMPEFRSAEFRHRWEQGMKDSVAQVEEKAALRYKQFTIAKAKGNFAMDYGTAIDDGDFDKAEALLHGGVGTYITPYKYQSELKKLDRARLEREASDLVDKNPEGFLAELYNRESKFHALPKQYLGRLQNSLSESAITTIDFSGKEKTNYANELFNENEEENEIWDSQNGESGASLSMPTSTGDGASAGSGEWGGNGSKRSGKVKLRSGVATPIGNLFRIAQSHGQVPAFETIMSVATAELDSVDVDKYRKYGAESLEFKTFLTARKLEWDAYGIPKEAQNNLAEYITSRVEAKKVKSNFDVNGILSYLEGSGDLVPLAPDKRSGSYDLVGMVPKYMELSGVKIKVTNDDLDGLLSSHQYKNKYNSSGKDAVSGYRKDEAAVKLALSSYMNNYVANHPEAQVHELANVMKEKMWDLTGRNCSIFDVVGSMGTQGALQKSYAEFGPQADNIELERKQRIADSKNTIAHLNAMAKEVEAEQMAKPLKVEAKRVPLVALGDYEDDALIIGRDHLKNLPEFESLDDLAAMAQFKLNDGRVYSPREVKIVDGNVFGLGKKAAMSLLIMPGQSKVCPMILTLPKKKVATKANNKLVTK